MVVLNFVRNSATFFKFRSQNHNSGRICDRFSRNLEHCKTVNSVILGQSLKSRGRKSNAGLESVKQFSSYCDTSEPVCKKPKKMKVLTTNKSSYSCISEPVCNKTKKMKVLTTNKSMKIMKGQILSNNCTLNSPSKLSKIR